MVCLLLHPLVILASDLSAQSVLMDFGTTLTINPTNGLTWNNYTNNTFQNLVTSQSNSTSYYFTPKTGGGFNVNFVPSGANLSALGAFNNINAASDAINTTTNASYYFYNINPNLTYDFSLFGSRDSTVTRITTYTAEGSNSGSGSVTTSGSNIGGTGINYNISTMVNITGIKSTNFGGSIGNGILLTLSNTTGGFAYLNAMSVEGYIGYLDGGTTTLNGAPASGYVANGTYANSDPRSVNTVIGGGSTVNVNHVDGIYYNSALIMTNGGGTINAGTNFSVYALQGSGNLAVSGGSQLTITRAGTFSGTLTLTNGNLKLAASNALGSGTLALRGGSLELSHAAALGSGVMTVAGGTTTLNNASALSALTGNTAINLNGGGATLQVNGYTKVLNLGAGNVTVIGTNNLNAWNGGLQFDGIISGDGLLSWYGAGNLTLGGSNTFAGTLRMNGNSGTVTLSNTNALQNALLNKGTNQTLAFGVPGTNTYKVGGLSGVGDLDMGGNRLAITSAATNTFSGNLAGTNGLVFNGSGTQILDGTLSYTGITQVNGGVLRLVKAGFSADLGAATLTITPNVPPNDGSTFVVLNGPTEGARTVFFSPALSSGLTASFDPSNSTVTVASSGPPAISSATSITHMYGSAFNYQIAASGSGITYAASGLPAGLTLNTNTGLITGNLAGPTNTVVQISAINSAGTNTISLVIDVTGQEFLVDFGQAPTTNAVSGKIWNNWTNGGQTLGNMVDSSGSSTGYSLAFTTGVAVNTNFGVIPNPAMGVFNEASVVTDALNTTSNATFKVSGLNKNNGYTFQIFGSRSATETRVTSYTLAGSNTLTGVLTNSGTDIGGSGANFCTNILTLAGAIPDRNGEIFVTYAVTQGQFGYLNAMRVTTTNYPTSASTYLSLANRWTDQQALSAEPSGAVVFFGSSSIRRWESLTRDFADYQVIHRGMGGAVFSDINQLLGQVVGVHQPRAVVLWAGVNDLYAYQSADYVFQQFTEFASTFTNQLPSAKLFYLGIPKNPEFAGTPSRDTERINANARIASFIQTNGNSNLHFVDLPAVFDTIPVTSSNDLSNTNNLWYYQVDAAHPNRAGYLIWKNEIRSALSAQGVLPDRVGSSNPLAPSGGQTVLFDFGPADVTNGEATLTADERGLFWNNWHVIKGGDTVVAGERKSDLVDSSGNPTGLSLTITGDFQANGKLNGGLTNLPSLGLGNLGTLTAAQDYFYSTGDALVGGGSDNASGGLRISGLNPSFVYDVRFLASRSVASTRQTRFEVYGASSNSIALQSSGAGIGVNRGDGNDQTLATVASVRPNAYGDIFIDVSALSQANSGDVVAYLNAMEIRVVSPYESWARSRGLTPGVNNALVSSNLETFAFDGTSMSQASLQGKIRGLTTSGPGAQALNLAFPVRKGTSFSGSTSLSATQDGVTYEVLGSSDLINWNLPVELVSAGDSTGLPALSDPTGYEYRKFRIKDDSGILTKGFLKTAIRAATNGSVPAVAGKAAVSAASYSDMSGVQVQGGVVGFFDGGDWLKYSGLDFGSGATSVTFSSSKSGTGGTVEIRLGSPTGRLIGTFAPQDTGGWSNYREQLAQLSGFVSGVQDVYLVAVGGTGVCNLESFRFSQYVLTWSDEFSGNSLNTNNWAAVDNGDVANGELQFYTPRTNNVSVTNGVLQLTAQRETYTGQGPWMSAPKTTAYTSGLIESLNKIQPQYGKIEASMKIPTGAGLWPAFWMMGVNYFPSFDWPACGEIDIMEYSGASGGFTAAFHTGAYNYMNNGGGVQNVQGFSVPNHSTEFHVYGIEWTPTRVGFYVDGKIILEAKKSQMGSSAAQWPFDQPFWLKLNLAIGGPYGGDPTSGTFPKTMEVDWVRVYQEQAAY